VLRDDYNASLDGLTAALAVLDATEARRRIVALTDASDAGGNRQARLKRLAPRLAAAAEVVVIIGESAAYGRRRIIEAGHSPATVYAFPSLQEAALFLRGELRAGDVALIKGRTSDHTARLLLAQLGPVACWRASCPKRTLCDHCWQLGLSQGEIARAVLEPPP
jgi:UDP-N-acetylmuramoyl-tripeptide--D-alanyl-D-alanine ligase